MERNLAAEFLGRLMAFVLLYSTSAAFFIYLATMLETGEALLVTSVIVVAAVLVLATVIQFAKSFIHMSPATIDHRDVIRSYCRVRLLFSSAVLFFFVSVFFWVSFLGGVLDSAMVSLLTTAPAFFVFGIWDRYWSTLEERYPRAVVSQQALKYYADTVVRGMCVLVYIATVVNFDVNTVLNVPGFSSFSLGYDFLVSPSAEDVISSRAYTAFALLTFLGSVVATVTPFLKRTID